MIRALGVLVLIAVLTGCSAAPSPAPANTGENGAATSGPAPEGDQVGNSDATMPADFPSEIPLVDGELVEAAGLGTGWVLLFRVDDANAGFAEAADALAGAGFTEDARNASETEGFAQYSSDAYTVQLSSNVEYPGYGNAVAYTVVKLG
jgi:hypothetical protein